MTVMTILTALSCAQDLDQGSYRYRVFGVVEQDKRWVVRAANGLFDCEATTQCVGLDAPKIFRSEKPTWQDGLVIFYVVDEHVQSCELRRCLSVQKTTHADLKSP